MQGGISNRLFYGRTNRIRVTNAGIIREERNIRIILPGANDSEAEDDDDDDELQNIATCMECDDDPDNDPDYAVALEENEPDEDREEDEKDDEEDEEDDDEDESEEDENGHEGKGRNKKNTKLRWRKRKSAQVDSTFVGDPFPDPPQEDMTPLQYFKQFFDEELISHIVEYPNLYSVQKSGTSVDVTKDESNILVYC